MALPPEGMYVLCFGYMPRHVPGLSIVRKLKSDATTEDDTGAHYLFGE